MKDKRKHGLVLSALLAALLAAACVSILLGARFIPLFDILKEQNRDLFALRLSRIILGMAVGASLSVSGCVLQGLLRNPLCEPYVLGISSGAGLGAAIAIVGGLGAGWLGVNSLFIASFLGAVLTMMLVYMLARLGGRVSAQGLVLSGVVVGAVFSSMLLFLISVSENRAARDAVWWLLGNLQIYDLKLLLLVGVISLTGISIALFFSRELNIISLGEEEAAHLGINTEALKKILFVVAGILTASCVSSCGIIGFVGLIVPHMMRLLVGPDHRILLPSSALFGALFLVVCDTFARTVMLPAEIPIGAVTALIGGPFFFYLYKARFTLRS